MNQDKQNAERIKRHCFCGFTLEEAAEVFGLSGTTAKRCRAFARACFYQEIKTPNSMSAGGY